MTSPDTKHLFFLRDSNPRADFVRAVREEIQPALTRLAPEGLSLSYTEAPNPRFGLVPLRRKNLLMVAVWGEVDPAAYLAALSRPGAEVFGYRVDASSPVVSERTWPLGERSPGVVLLTLLAKNPRLDASEFMHEWHERHTPKALRIHPLFGYVRNVVTASLVDGAPRFEGVVEEHYRSRADVTNPVRMFGGFRFLANLVEVARHVNHFLDLSRTENYLLAEVRAIEP